MAMPVIGGAPVHDNHTAYNGLTTNASALRTKTTHFTHLLIYNAGATEAQLSFDDGTGEFPIPAGASVSLSFPPRLTYRTSGNVALKVILGQG